MSGPYLPDQQVVTVLGENATVKGVLSDGNKLLIVLDSGHELIVDTTFVQPHIEPMAEPDIGLTVFDADLTLWTRAKDGNWYTREGSPATPWERIENPALAVPLDPDHLAEFGYVRSEDLKVTGKIIATELVTSIEQLTTQVEDLLDLIGGRDE